MLRRKKSDLRRTYEEALSYSHFGDRLNYLSLANDKYIPPVHNNPFYHSRIWLDFKHDMHIRDLGYDLAVDGMDIEGMLLLHHINPVTEEDLDEFNEFILLNPDNVITTTHKTHNIIHYKKKIVTELPERKPGDTLLW